MINGRIVVKVIHDKENGELKFVFPEEEDRATACFRLAQIALENKENAEYRVGDGVRQGGQRGIDLHAGDGVGHLRNLFLGSTASRLYDVSIRPNETIRFVFRNREFPVDEEVVILRRKTESMTFVLEEQPQR